MKTIVLEVDDESGNAYHNFSSESKDQFLYEVTHLMKKAVCDARITKLKKFLNEMNNEPEEIALKPDILLELLFIDQS